VKAADDWRAVAGQLRAVEAVEADGRIDDVDALREAS
jgi:hypothetical protein